MKIKITLTIALVMGALLFSLTNSDSTAQAQKQNASAAETTMETLGDACKNVKFKFTNNHSEGVQIEVLKVKYFNQANGQWQTEDIQNKVCNQGATCTTSGDNLSDSEGENLTKFRFIFRWKSNAAGANWSDEVEGGDKVPTNGTCNANKTYGPGATGWSITG